MDDPRSKVTPGEPMPAPPVSGKRPAWLVVVGVISIAALCGSAGIVLLVLTGIIAEPETVIEQIIRAIVGG